MVEMGTDRIHHGFWRFSDPEHRLYEPGNPYEAAMLDYYRALGREAGPPARASPTTTRPCSSSPITAPSGWTAASA